jgi:hypothetical protein
MAMEWIYALIRLYSLNKIMGMKNWHNFGGGKLDFIF